MKTNNKHILSLSSIAGVLFSVVGYFLLQVNNTINDTSDSVQTLKESVIELKLKVMTNEEKITDMKQENKELQEKIEKYDRFSKYSSFSKNK